MKWREIILQPTDPAHMRTDRQVRRQISKASCAESLRKDPGL
jgi:hypothetical protein